MACFPSPRPFGRIQKVDPPLGSIVYAGSTSWILRRSGFDARREFCVCYGVLLKRFGVEPKKDLHRKAQVELQNTKNDGLVPKM